MNESLVALKLLLDELKVSSDIKSLDDRKRVQKAVYLGQQSGVDLGYRFGWYVMGPYSPSLARDYYQLADEVAADAEYLKGKRLRAEAGARLKALAGILKVPSELKSALDQPAWLELLASYHYLRKVTGQNEATALATMETRKPHLAEHVGDAMKALESVGLLAA